jgi:predicted Zn-dependent protease
VRHLLVLALGALLFLTACETVPVTGRSQVMLFSEDEVVKLADQAHIKFIAEAQQKGTIVTAADSTSGRDVALINTVARRIIDAAGLGSRYKWEITVLRDPTANASVMPNGKMVVHTGLLPVTRTDAGLAVVLGHEVGHVVARHSAERLSQSMLLETGTQVAASTVASSPALQALTAGALGLGAQFGVLMPYSRAHESEADRLGLIFMAKAGYDPAEALALWERMEKAGGSRTPEFLSTHPHPETRRAQIREWLPEAQRYYKDRSLPLPR